MNTTEHRRPAWVRLGVPSVSTCLWLAVFLTLTLSGWRIDMISADGDSAMHWAVGNWMIEHREIIRTDPFSFTRAGAPVITKEWLSEIGFAAAGNWLGWNGLVLVAAALIATTLWLLLRQMLAEGTDILLTAALVLLAALSCQIHWAARPHLVTHLLVVFFAGKLREFAREKLPASQLFAWLVPGTLLWVNLHGAFFIGFVLIGCYVVAAIIGRVPRVRLQALLGLLAACLVVSLLNPNGWKLHAMILEYLWHPRFVGGVNEFLSPNFHSPTVRGFEVQLLVLGLTLLVARPRLTVPEIVLTGVWGYFALHSMRNIPIFCLVLTPILAAHLQVFLRQIDAAWIRSYWRVSADVATINRAAGGHLLAGAVIVGLLLALVVPRSSGGRPLLTTEPQPSRFPVEAVKFVRAQPGTVRGEMFSTDYWGSYLTLTLPEHKVFVDSRLDFYITDFIKEYVQVATVKPGWADLLDKYGVNWALLPADHRLSVMLGLHSQWQEVYRDEVAVIYARNTD